MEGAEGAEGLGWGRRFAVVRIVVRGGSSVARGEGIGMLSKGFPVRVVAEESYFSSKFSPTRWSAPPHCAQLAKGQALGGFWFSLFRARSHLVDQTRIFHITGGPLPRSLAAFSAVG
jgi:hypothetical protein